MQNINSELYRTNIFYRDLVDKMLANEKSRKYGNWNWNSNSGSGKLNASGCKQS